MGKYLTEELLSKYKGAQIFEFHTKVVGTTFRNQDEINEVEDGDYAYIQPEVGNEYDPFACKILHDKTGYHIGYVMKQNSAGVALSKEIWENSIKNGDLYVAKCSITGGKGRNKGINLQVRRIHMPSPVTQ